MLCLLQVHLALCELGAQLVLGPLSHQFLLGHFFFESRFHHLCGVFLFQCFWRRKVARRLQACVVGSEALVKQVILRK